MISFTPTEEQQMLIDAVRRYSANDVRPVAHDSDENGGFPESGDPDRLGAGHPARQHPRGAGRLWRVAQRR